MSTMAPQLQPPACEVCKAKEPLQPCRHCEAVYYCSEEHWSLDYPNHIDPCGIVCERREALVNEEIDLRNMPAGPLTPSDVFNTCRGRFWGIIETRPYMRARVALADSLIVQFGTVGGRASAVQESLDHLIELVHLSRSDNLGVRDLIPGQLLRLQRDQDALDFMQFWNSVAHDPYYDYGNLDEPHLNVKDSDIFMPMTIRPGGSFIGLTHSVAVMLIKLRAYMDLVNVRNASKALQGRLPQEILDLVRERLVNGIVKSKPQILRSSDAELKRLVLLMKKHIKQLYQCSHEHNRHFWKIMFESPYEAMANRPDKIIAGALEEARYCVGSIFPAWAETPGSFAQLKAIMPKLEITRADKLALFKEVLETQMQL